MMCYRAKSWTQDRNSRCAWLQPNQSRRMCHIFLALPMRHALNLIDNLNGSGYLVARERADDQISVRLSSPRDGLFEGYGGRVARST